MNLDKVYPYLPAGLGRVMSRFSVGASINYDKMSQITDDLEECASALGWQWGRGRSEAACKPAERPEA